MKFRSVVVLNFSLLLLALAFAPSALAEDERDYDIKLDTSEKKPDERCRGMKTLQVGAENLITTKAEWDKFSEENPMFVVGGADSTCPGCCDSEPLLLDLLEVVKDKKRFSFPQKNKKQKKIIRKEIKIARVDLDNKELTSKLGEFGIWFPMGTTVLLVREGRTFKYDGPVDHVDSLVHHLQRIATPAISLTSEESILEFLETQPAKIWTEDYYGALCAKGEGFDEEQVMDSRLEKWGLQTRVVAFYYDKDDYKDEIEMLRHTGQYMANRYNLRIALVTDKKLITRMRKAHPDLFLDSNSVMVMRRYDGTQFKLNVAETEPARYVWWITMNSVKPVEKISDAGYQATEVARMPIISIFVDYSEPKVAAKSRQLIKNMEVLAKEYRESFLIFWSDEEQHIVQRTKLGITWDELPALGMTSIEQVQYAYPRESPFDETNLRAWMNQIRLKKTAETDVRATDFAKRQRDPTIAQYFLDKAIQADRRIFEDDVIKEDTDSIVLFYSTENVNYVQRKACFQYNLAIETLSDSGKYGSMVPDQIKFYAYDAYVNGFPKGIPIVKSPPQDINAQMMASQEQRDAGLPAVYVFPARKKSLPYQKFLKFPYAEDLIMHIEEKSNNFLKLKADDHEGLGRQTSDEIRFQSIIDKEGIIVLDVAYDEL